jgi:hypothetical protein
MSKYAGTGLDPNNQNISDCTKQNLRGKECSNNFKPYYENSQVPPFLIETIIETIIKID